MLQSQLDSRRRQSQSALAAIEFFEGRPVDPQQFFEVYYSVLPARGTAPNRNTMDDVLSSGGLRLIRDADIRARLLALYATYDGIGRREEHMAREFDSYLYDPTFSSIGLQYEGPWEDTQANQQAVETLLDDIRIENGLRLVVINIGSGGGGLIGQLEFARSQVEGILELISEE